MKKHVRRVDTPLGRVYAYGKGADAILMPSVTTILSAEPSPYLDDLENKLGKAELKRLGERAVIRGSAMHKFLENYFICKQHGADDDKALLYTQKKTPIDLRAEGFEEDKIVYGRNLFYNFIYDKIFDQVGRVIGTEQFLWSLIHKFAGTTDFIFENKDLLEVIVDFKSASGIRGDETVNKYKKQTGAYAIGYEEIYNKPITNTQIWISNPEGMQLISIKDQELEHYKQEFILSCQKFHKNWDFDPIQKFYIDNYVS